MLAVLLAFGGCAGGGLRPRTAPEPGEADGAPRERLLYRVSYQGPEGAGAFRLALTVAAADRYLARASDGFGRALWSLELAGADARFVDHRRRRFCHGGREMPLPELALDALPLPRLPAVLAGELPEPPAAGENDPVDFRDAGGRRWTVRKAGSDLVGWTLWSEEEPLLWWTRDDRGGILSHRGGAQFRWRLAVAEPLDSAPPTLEIPHDYVAVGCRTLTADGG